MATCTRTTRTHLATGACARTAPRRPRHDLHPLPPDPDRDRAAHLGPVRRADPVRVAWHPRGRPPVVASDAGRGRYEGAAVRPERLDCFTWLLALALTVVAVAWVVGVVT